MYLSFDRALELLREISNENPGYVYADDPKSIEAQGSMNCGNLCLYKHLDGCPGCIIGHLISRFLGHDNWFAVEFQGPEATLTANSINADEDTIRLLAYVQLQQDAGEPWRRAVNLGLATYEGEKAKI